MSDLLRKRFVDQIKVLFGTDWPVIDPERAVREVAALGLRPESHARSSTG